MRDFAGLFVKLILFVNSCEQMFAEKLLSLLRHGVVSNRPKDIFDLHYLLNKVSPSKLGVALREFIYDNSRCRVNDKSDMLRALDVIFSAKPFLRRLNNAKANWLQMDPSKVIADILSFLAKRSVI